MATLKRVSFYANAVKDVDLSNSWVTVYQLTEGAPRRMYSDQAKSARFSIDFELEDDGYYSISVDATQYWCNGSTP